MSPAQIIQILKGVDRKVYLQTAALFILAFFLIKHIVYNPYVSQKMRFKGLQKKYALVADILDKGHDMSSYDSMLFVSGNVGEVIPIINTFLEENKIEVISITPTPVTKMFGLKVISFEIKFRSNFERLVNFLSDVESYDKALLVEQLKVHKEEVDVEKMDEAYVLDPQLTSLVKIKMFTR